MKRKLLLSTLLCSSIYILLGQGTRPDNAKVILGSRVVRTINVIANDNAVAGKTFEVVGVFKTTPKDIAITHATPNVTYQDNHNGPQNDTFYYIARDINSGSLDTNYVVITKDYINQDLYPGDANKDNICNNIDVLNIGIAYGKSEIIREGIYLSNDWVPVKSYDWSLTSMKSNYSYSDANGDGIVDSMGDVATIIKNYKRHAGIDNIHYSPSGGESFKLIAPDTIKSETSTANFSININLGTNSVKVEKAYGLAFTIKYNPTLIKPNNIKFKPSKWFSDNETCLNFSRIDTNSGEIDVTLVRKSGKNGDGQGELGVVDVVEIDILDVIDLNFEIVKPVLIDSIYNVLPITLPNPKPIHLVKKSSSQISLAQRYSGLRYYQNDQILTLKNDNSKPIEVSIVNILGKEISKRVLAPNQPLDIDTNLWSSGIYFLKTSSEAYKIHVK